MASKNEIMLATLIDRINSLLIYVYSHRLEQEEDCSVYVEVESIKDKLAEILSQPEEGDKSDERFYYTGIDQLEMSQSERNDLGVCEFSVTQRGIEILKVYWSADLEWIMQPSEDGESFVPVAKKRFPKIAGARGYLKKLAEEELAEPGAFAKKFYVSRPSVIIRKAR